ncbi:MAG TPA: hypothetical protein VKH41_07280 [Myxococcota bacterium]|nr:hypothetical protein [Myxococcota bacterium]
MKPGLGIRIALASAALLAQLVLPIAHGLRAESPSGSDSTGASVAAAAASANCAAHDPSACPICTALCQVRAGVGRSLPTAALLASVASSRPVEHTPALPGSPDLDASSPRAPPALSLA